MSSELWQQAKQALAEAKALYGEKRQEFLDSLEQQSPELAAEVLALLKASETAEMEGFLELPAVDTEEKHLEETIDYSQKQFDTVVRSTNSDATVAGPSPPGSPGHVPMLSDDYELQGRVGKGGMGEVFRAYQHSLRRHVALKLIPERYLPTPDQVARFKIEAESAASLDHPGIVPVYEVGERLGMHFYSMALVEGGSLADYVGKGKTRLSHREAAVLMEQVCHAVQYAHDRAVIHRDIKPANILLDKQRKPRLTDFGLAKVLKEEEDLTMTGQVMGTPSYMAPEQAKGDQKELSNRTDVYALGATLYSLLAGRPPFAAENAMTTIREVMDKPAPPVTNFAPNVPLDLQTICEKCLAKRPIDRYESASDLADDLRRYLDGFPIAARPQGWLMRSYLWSRRNSAVASLIGVTAVTLIIASIISSVLAVQANRALDRSEANAQRLNEAIDELFVEVSERELFQEPGMQSVRETLLTSAQRYYEELLATGQTSVAKTARTTFRLGRVQAELGKTEAAAKSFDTAIERYEQLLEESGDDPNLFVALAKVHNEYSILGEQQLFELGERPEFELEPLSKVGVKAIEMWRTHAFQCADWRERALKISPDDRNLQRLLANAKMNLGLAIVEEARSDGNSKGFERARSLYRDAKDLRLSLLAEVRDDVDVLIDLSDGYAAEADLKTAQAEALDLLDPEHKLWKEVFQLRNEAVETLGKVSVENYDDQRRLEWQIINVYQKCGDSHFLLWQNREAIIYYKFSERTLRNLQERNPRVTKYRKKLADSYFNHSQALLRLADPNGYDLLKDCQDSLIGALRIDPRDKQALDLLDSYSMEFVNEFLGDENAEQLKMKAIEIVEHVINSLKELPVLKEKRSLIDVKIKHFESILEDIRRSSEPKDQVALVVFS